MQVNIGESGDLLHSYRIPDEFLEALRSRFKVTAEGEEDLVCSLID